MHKAFSHRDKQCNGELCVQDTGDTALHLAAAGGSLNDRGRQEALDVLLGLGASPDLPNRVRAFDTCL